MKPIKIHKEKMKTIDNDIEHYQILCDLGILDDMEDWAMYQKQELKYLELLKEIEIENYFSYMRYVRQK